MPGSSKWSLSLRFSHQNPVYASPFPIRATCPALVILLHLVTRTILGEEYRTLISLLCSFLHSPVKSRKMSSAVIEVLFGSQTRIKFGHID